MERRRGRAGPEPLLPVLLAALLAAACGEEAATIEVPAGASFVATLRAPLGTAEGRVGDSFEATVEEPLRVRAETVIGRGATVRGQITNVVRGTEDGAMPSLTLVFREVVDPSGIARTIHARPLVVAGERAEAPPSPSMPILAAGSGPIFVPASPEHEVALPAGQPLRVEFLELVEFPL